MPISVDPALRELNACGCGAGSSPETPVRSENRPGLSVLVYRTGTQARFLASMLARLSDARQPQLSGLKTRATSDPTIAFLDACAAVDDVLTFYQERYANESYLRTATERLSLVYLARLIGYEPRPGVAASTYLAFTVEDTPGSPEQTFIEAGTRVQSIPGPDELPQSFETARRIEARAQWNAMKVRTRVPQVPTSGMSAVLVRGIEAGVKRGDRLLVVTSTGARAVKTVRAVWPDNAHLTTRIEFDSPASTPPQALTAPTAALFKAFGQALTTSTLLNHLNGKVFTSANLRALSLSNQWSEARFTKAANAPQKTVDEPAEAGVFALRQRAALFGHNAPNWETLPQSVEVKANGQRELIPGKYVPQKLAAGTHQNPQYPNNWETLKLSERPNMVDLDNTYPALTKASWLVLESSDGVVASYRITGNQELTRSEFAISAKVTRLTLDASTNFDVLTMRNTTAHGQSEQLPLAELPLTEPLTGATLTLDRYYPGLASGQFVIVTGQRADLKGTPGVEARRIKEVVVDGALEQDTTGRLFTRLELDAPLEFTYEIETVLINANIAAATHGESKAEVLGSGDAKMPNQTFALHHTPLTYTSADTPTGVQSSLEVRVNELLWQEAPNLYGRAPDERVYMVRVEDDGQTRVRFNGRLPSGQENVRVRYRQGLGLAGRVKANQLSLLAVRPLGVRGVSNPLAATGGQDAEKLAAIRRNAPLTALTLDRLVSLRDYEDFARSFAGFAKAKATLTTDGERQGIFVTVAGAGGAVLGETSPEFKHLVAALKQFGDPHVSFVVKPYQPEFFQLEARLGVDPAFLADQVVAAVEAALRAAFSFDARDFAQAVNKSEVIALIQAVPGVVFVDLDFLFRTIPAAPESAVKTLADRLTPALPKPGVRSTEAQPAGILTLDYRPVPLGVIAA
jgi:predicted phage baseplate assembly protein